METGRPIIVFFESLKKLKEALGSDEMNEIRNYVRILSEELN